jgi:hypothetical protein
MGVAGRRAGKQPDVTSVAGPTKQVEDEHRRSIPDRFIAVSDAELQIESVRLLLLLLLLMPLEPLKYVQR